jgi:hypothetical protein
MGVCVEDFVMNISIIEAQAIDFAPSVLDFHITYNHIIQQRTAAYSSNGISFVSGDSAWLTSALEYCTSIAA